MNKGLLKENRAMDTELNRGSKSKKSELPSRKRIQELLNLEQEALDQEISFEPITTGLGFKKKKESKPKLEQKPFPKVILTQENIEKNRPETREVEGMRNDLKAFYETEEKKTRAENLSKVESVSPKASFSSRLFAFAIDNLFIAIIAAGSLMSVNLILSWILNEPVLSWDNDSFLMAGFFFAFYFLCYFTISERLDGSTPGKRLMNLEIETSNGRLSLGKSILRAIMGLASIPLMGLPTLAGFDNWLTKSRVIKK